MTHDRSSPSNGSGAAPVGVDGRGPLARHDVELYRVAPTATLRDAARCIDKNQSGAAFVLDADQRLVSTITDGDLRRALLDGCGLDDSVAVIADRKQRAGAPPPVSAPRTIADAEARTLFAERGIRQLPLLDEAGRMVDVLLLDDVRESTGNAMPISAVIMAGGFGERLRPLTNDTPKPMLPVGDRPLLEHIVTQLRDAGIHELNVTTHFQPEKIRDHFGDGSAFGVNVSYVSEETPLGTAGALGLVEKPKQPMLVINGDILTRVNYQAMYAFHREHQAELTVAVRQYALKVPYGVLECDGAQVKSIKEKPSYNFLVNAGVYLLEPGVRDLIPAGKRIDMTDVIELLLAQGRRVASFPVVEYWIDIGRHDDYQRAQDDFRDFKNGSRG